METNGTNSKRITCTRRHETIPRSEVNDPDNNSPLLDSIANNTGSTGESGQVPRHTLPNPNTHTHTSKHYSPRREKKTVTTTAKYRDMNGHEVFPDHRHDQVQADKRVKEERPLTNKQTKTTVCARPLQPPPREQEYPVKNSDNYFRKCSCE